MRESCDHAYYFDEGYNECPQCGDNLRHGCSGDQFKIWDVLFRNAETITLELNSNLAAKDRKIRKLQEENRRLRKMLGQSQTVKKANVRVIEL